MTYEDSVKTAKRYELGETHHWYGRNEHFVPNMLGKEISFDVQPYRRGKGKLVAITVRTCERNEFCPRYGQTTVRYEIFDLEIEMIEGSSTGALWGGVPVPRTVRDIAGKTEHVSGVRYGQLVKAVEDGEIIVIATCG